MALCKTQFGTKDNNNLRDPWQPYMVRYTHHTDVEEVTTPDN
jgi:hypothetical protein